MSPEYIIFRVLIGLVIGLVIGMTGVGGGVLVMPALAIVLKLDPSVAVGTAGLYAFLTKCYAVVVHYRLKTIEWGVSLLFLGGALPSIIGAPLVVIHCANQDNSEAVAHFQGNLKLLITWVMVFAGALLIFDLVKKINKGDMPEKNERSGSPTRISGAKKILGTLCGFIVGALIGSTSVGGGILVIPFLMIFFGLSTRQTVGSSIFIAVSLTLISSFLYAKGGNMDHVTALIMWGGSLIGVFFGSRLTMKIPDKVLQAIVVVIIILATALMTFSAGGH